MNSELKRNLFLTTVEATLLYSCESWTHSAKIRLHIRWLLHPEDGEGCDIPVHVEGVGNEVLYGIFPRVTGNITERKFRLAGHYVRHSGGGVTYVDRYRGNSRLQSTTELKPLMADR